MTVTASTTYNNRWEPVDGGEGGLVLRGISTVTV